MSSTNVATSSGRLFINGRFFSSNLSNDTKPYFWDCMFVKDGTIEYVGHKEDDIVHELTWNGQSEVIDLQGKIVLPGFIDAHMHLLLLGQSLQKLDLDNCKNLKDIRQTIGDYVKWNSSVERILCRGWMQSMTDGEAKASMLDDLSDKPIFIDSKDLHSTWCNSPALQELGIDSLGDPAGGIIERDASGKPSGLVSESVVLNTVWPHLATVASMDEKKTALRAAISAYNTSGYTGLVDMAMDENGWAAILALQDEDGPLPIRISAYWLITPSRDKDVCLAQVDRAITLSKRYNSRLSPDLRIVGIKVICDGVIDACTAALLEPYSKNAVSIDPLWTADMLWPVVQKADQAGLQCALHAIGDAAVRLAIDAIEQNCTPGKRHRIEHLEMTSPEDGKRLGELGITASIQPVHSDPAILRAWPDLLGPKTLGRAFAYKDFADGGATIAIGSDSPTAPWSPLANLYVATTRKSAKDPKAEDAAVNSHFALSLYQAITGATAGAAYSSFAEGMYGELKAGLKADFVVVDMMYDPVTLLEARVLQTWFSGRKVYDIIS
ncbi:amidohydrolase 3 [Microthyrium microscopicum]|uniref:Amidohydrolase 3 n=1 Tax=Microthyrium microscopicum TaxID=703497 RepID=A0A6A6UTI7_9PEZI|nr:amidohydrolase 3 [Microthyrium microscopicum]